MERFMAAEVKAQPILVKRYARTRLYNSTAQYYVTVQELRRWAAKGLSFVVIDAETKAEVTQVLLAEDPPPSGVWLH